MNMIKTAYRGATIASLRNLNFRNDDNRAEYQLAAQDAGDLLDSIPVNSPNEGKPSTAQAALIAKLVEDLRKVDPEAAKLADEYMVKMTGRWTSGRDGNASRWIDRLISKVKESTLAYRASIKTVQPIGVEDGMYVLNGEIFKVQHAVHGSGKQYAKLLVPNETPGVKATFVYAPGVVTKLRPEHRMTKDQAREYGALYGTCVRCGAVLTAEDSIDRMMGPVCSGKI